MNAGICHILAPEEFTQWFAGTPKHYLVVVDAVELQRLQNALVRVAAVYVTLADDFAAQGYVAREIAEILGKSKNTVSAQLRKMTKRLGLQSTRDIIKVVHQLNL